MQGYGTPFAVYVVYALKVAFYIGMWVFFCSFSPELGGLGTIGQWWLHPLAFQKAIVWSMLFEVLGLGCGSGPLTGRYFPPIGGALHFLRKGTIKLPPFPSLPFFGRDRRSELDIVLYVALIVSALKVLVAPSYASWLPMFPGWGLLEVVFWLGLLGLTDRTVFLAARAEHYWVTMLCFLFCTPWIAGAKAVQLALWFWAGFSKINHHFPTVLCVMLSNGPFTRFAWLRRALYASYPDDLGPSKLATRLAHLGTALEIAVPLAFVLTPLGSAPVVAILLMLVLHLFIVSSVPMGVPIEWNVMVVYGGFALFWAHPGVSPFAVGPGWFAAFLVAMVVGVPLLGNLFPRHVSFLMSMRYYAGNWPFSIWLFRGDAYRKLDRLTKSSRWVGDQLEMFYDSGTAAAVLSKVCGFRLMHLHGRALPLLVPQAVTRLEDYEWVDGEIVAGLTLGWNFGDGHLHQEQLLEAVQGRCQFEPGELRCIFVESQPLLGRSLGYRIVDASSGLMASGELDVGELRTRQPWSSCV